MQMRASIQTRWKPSGTVDDWIWRMFGTILMFDALCEDRIWCKMHSFTSQSNWDQQQSVDIIFHFFPFFFGQINGLCQVFYSCMDVRMKLHWCMLTSPPCVGWTDWQLAAALWTSATLFAEEQNNGCCLMDMTHSISHVVVHDVLLASWSIVVHDVSLASGAVFLFSSHFNCGFLAHDSMDISKPEKDLIMTRSLNEAESFRFLVNPWRASNSTCCPHWC